MVYMYLVSSDLGYMVKKMCNVNYLTEISIAFPELIVGHSSSQSLGILFATLSKIAELLLYGLLLS